MRIIILAIITISISISAYSYFSATKPEIEKPTLIQHYEIQSTRNNTVISGTVKFRVFKYSKDFYPQMVKFNDQPMQNKFPDRDWEDFGGCSKDNKNLLRVIAREDYIPQADKSVFSLIQKGYENKNKIDIYDEDGELFSYSIYFEPIKFKQPDQIVLSRSQDNTVELIGIGSLDNLPSFGIGQKGNSVDEESFKYDKKNNVLHIPARSLTNLSNGKANFWIINGEGKVIGTPNSKTVNSYIISYTDATCIEIVN